MCALTCDTHKILIVFFRNDEQPSNGRRCETRNCSFRWRGERRWPVKMHTSPPSRPNCSTTSILATQWCCPTNSVLLQCYSICIYADVCSVLISSYHLKGLLTTPQLHFLVRCHNDPTYGTPTEDGYNTKMATAFLALYKTIGMMKIVFLSNSKRECGRGEFFPSFFSNCNHNATPMCDRLHNAN